MKTPGRGYHKLGIFCKRLRVFTGVPHNQSAGLKYFPSPGTFALWVPSNAFLVPALPQCTLWT